MFGGEIWDPETYKIKGVLDSKENAAALDFTRRLYEAGKGINPSGERDFGGALQDFCDGKSPMLQIWAAFSGVFTSNVTCPGGGEFDLYKDVGFHPLPYSSTTNIHKLSLGGMGMHVRKTSENVDLAIDLIKYVISYRQQVTWAELGGFTVRKSVTASSSFLSTSNGMLIPYNAVFLQSFPLTKDFWNVDVWQPMLSAHQRYLLLALNGTLSSTDALHRMAVDQQAIMDEVYPCGPFCLREWDTLDSVRFIFSALSGLCILGTLVVAGFIYKVRLEPIIKASSVPFLFLILLGVGLGFSYVLLLHDPSPSDALCISQTWVSNIAFSLSFGALFSKTYRISRIFHSKHLADNLLVSNSTTLAMLGGIVLIFIVHLSIWVLIESPTSKRRVVGSGPSARQYVECELGVWQYPTALFKLMFLIWGSYLAFTVRNTPSAFNEAKYIGMCIHNWIVIGFFAFITEESVDSPLAKYIVKSMAIFLTLPVVIVLLFIPKILSAFSSTTERIVTTTPGGGLRYVTAAASKYGQHQVRPTDYFQGEVSPRASKARSRSISTYMPTPQQSDGD